jgi:hypothetical protein
MDDRNILTVFVFFPTAGPDIPPTHEVVADRLYKSYAPLNARWIIENEWSAEAGNMMVACE